MLTTNRSMAESGHVALAEPYLDRKSPPLNAKEKANVLHKAITARHARLAKRLLAMYASCFFHSLFWHRYLIQDDSTDTYNRKAPVTALDERGLTPLHNALLTFAGTDLDDVVQALLSAGSDIHFQHTHNVTGPGRTSLQFAISHRKYSAVELMLRHQPLHNDSTAPKGLFFQPVPVSAHRVQNGTSV